MPPSQDKIKMNAFAACAREFMRNAHGYSLALKKMEKEHLLKQKLFRAKLNKIGKLGSRKVNPITPRQELSRLANAEKEWLKDVLTLIAVCDAMACSTERRGRKSGVHRHGRGKAAPQVAPAAP